MKKSVSKLKAVLLILLISSLGNSYNIFGLELTNNRKKVTIVEIDNKSDSKANLKLGAEKIIDVLSKKKINREIEIPFISVSRNIVDFTQDKFYIPKGALKVITNLGKFGIWKNEDGLMFAQKTKYNFEKKSPEKLDLNHPETISEITKVVLFINSQGKPELKIK